MRLRRDLVRVVDMNDEAAERPALATPEECFEFVWDLTKEAYSLSGKFDVESRLQRDVVRVVRSRQNDTKSARAEPVEAPSVHGSTSSP